jgi:arylsulfatase A
MLLRWPDGIDGAREINEMVHFSDWFPTILSMVDVPVPRDLRIDGVDVLPAVRGEKGRTCTKRFWQWNRYTPLVTCNAAVRDGDWKLVRPAIAEALAAPCCDPWLRISMYEPERLIESGPITDPEPPRTVPPPPPPELYNIASDPLETENLADEHPDVVQRLLRELETWFEEVERERATIEDEW